MAERGDSRDPPSRGVPSRDGPSRGVPSRDVPSRISLELNSLGVVALGVGSRGVLRGDSRGEARGECRGDARGELARSGCRSIDDTDPPCLIVSAGLWLPELLLGEPGDDTVTWRERGGAGRGPRSGDCGRYWPTLTDERTWNRKTNFYVEDIRSSKRQYLIFLTIHNVHVRAASGLLRAEPRELAAEMLLMLPLDADMDWLRAELGLANSKKMLS